MKILVSNIGSLLTIVSLINVGTVGKSLLERMDMESILAAGKRVEFDLGGHLKWYYIASNQVHCMFIPVLTSLFNPSVFLIMTN